MPIPSDDPTLRKQAESPLNTAFRGMRTSKGFVAAYIAMTAPVYLVGEWSNPYKPLGRGVIGVGACALLGGLYLGGWYVAHNPGATTFGSDHLYAGLILCALAVGLAILETYEDYLGTSVYRRGSRADSRRTRRYLTVANDDY